MSQTKKEQLTVDVTMDENLIPESIQWKSSQENHKLEKASAALIYFWNAEKMKRLIWTMDKKMSLRNDRWFSNIMTLAIL